MLALRTFFPTNAGGEHKPSDKSPCFHHVSDFVKSEFLVDIEPRDLQAVLLPRI